MCFVVREGLAGGVEGASGSDLSYGDPLPLIALFFCSAPQIMQLTKVTNTDEQQYHQDRPNYEIYTTTLFSISQGNLQGPCSVVKSAFPPRQLLSNSAIPTGPWPRIRRWHLGMSPLLALSFV